MSSVTVAAIPEAYQNVTSVTATAGDVLATKVIVNAEGETVVGTMPNNGAVNKLLDASTASYTVPKGYHSGAGTVSIELEEKSVTPSTSAQTVAPTKGKVLSKVTVAAIPGNFGDTSDATATDEHLLAGKIAYGYDSVSGKAVKLEGAMANNGSVTATMDGMTTTSVSIPAGYTTGGTISLTDDIETALAAI